MLGGNAFWIQLYEPEVIHKEVMCKENEQRTKTVDSRTIQH